MLEHGTKSLGELTPAAALQLVGRGRQTIVAHDARDGAQGPHRPLQARDQRLKCLTGCQRDVGPATEGEDPFEQQMGERLALDRDAQVAGVGEIERALAAWFRRLLEIRLEIWPMPRSPIADPTL